MMLHILQAFLQDLYHRPDFWVLATIPVAAALIGLVTNWVAIQMIFSPVDYVGIGRLVGWQGIVPAKAGKLAGILVDNTLAKLASLTELFEGLGPERITEDITRAVGSSIEDYVDEIMTERNSVLWENLPPLIKRRIYSRARRQMPEIVDNVVEDIAQNIEELIDLRPMVVRRMTEEPSLLVRLFRECGAAELSYVVWSGLLIGLLVGVAELAVYVRYPSLWILLGFGFLAGYVSNWLGLYIVFRPVNPTRIGPFLVQGLFQRHKRAVAEKFAEICATEVINLRSVMIEVLTGPRSDRTKAIIKRHLRPLLESGVVRTAVQLALGPEGYVGLKHFVADKAVAMSIEPLVELKLSRDRLGVIHTLFCTRMQAMSDAEFQLVLRPVFEEDEWALITVGGLIGLAAGAALWLMVLSHSLF